MFEDDEESLGENQLDGDIEQFEAHLVGNDLGFIDSHRMEAIIDHYFSLSDFKKAKRAAQIADANFGYNNIFKLRIAQALCGEKKYNAAIDLLSKLSAEGLPTFELLVTFGSVYSQMGQFKKGVDYLLQALPLAEHDELADIYHDIAHAYAQMDDFEQSILTLERGLKDLPNCESLLYELGFTYDRVGKFAEAIQTYLDYIDENPYASMAWYNLGNTYSKVEDFAKAIWAYDYCILIFNEFAPAHFNLGNAYLSSGKHHMAIECFKNVLELEGDDPMAFCYLGEAHEQLQEYEIAINYYRLSLEIQPDLYEAWLGLGIIKDLQGYTKEALPMLYKAREYAEGNASVTLVLANAFQKLEDRNMAEEFYLEAIALDQEDPDSLHDYVHFLMEESPIAALKYLEENQEELMSNSFFTVLLCHILVHLGRNDDALLLFSGLVQQDRLLAEKLFEWNPKLRKHKDFVALYND